MTQLDTTLPLAPQSSSPAAASAPAWLETAALAALALTAGALLGGRDALVLRPELAWLALAPLLAGLRYGPGHGTACGIAQAGALLAAAHWGEAVVEVPLGQLALAWLVAGLVAGWFRDAWARRMAKAEAREAGLRERLNGLARSYQALRAAHDSLQQEGAEGARAPREPGHPFPANTGRSAGRPGRVRRLRRGGAGWRARDCAGDVSASADRPGPCL